MRPLRIALCSFSYGAANGIARMDELLATGLEQAGFAVQRFLIGPWHSGPVQRTGNSCLVSLEQAPQLLPQAFANIDIVQFNGATDPCVTQAACESGVPLILESLHTMDQGGMYPQIDAAIAVSSAVRARQPHPVCHLAPNGVDLERFTYKEGAHGVPHAVVLQVANAGTALVAGLEQLLPELVAARPHARALLAGGRTASAQPHLANLGVVADMPAVYHQADIVFMPSTHDAFGLALAEGMACGTLPLGMRHTGAADIIEHGQSGWLMDASPGHMKQKLLQAIDCLGSPAHRRMQQQARKRVEQHFSMHACVQRYAAIYQNALLPPRRVRLFEHSAWAPLVRLAMLCPVDLERAKQCFAAFVRQGQAVSPPGPHPVWGFIINIACSMGTLLLHEGHRDMVRAFFLLMRSGAATHPEFARLKA